MKTLLARGTAWLVRDSNKTHWFEIWLGPIRVVCGDEAPQHAVTCSCGGTITDQPREFDFTITKGACGHLIALYTGDVTTDVQAQHAALLASGGSNWPHYVQLTETGAAMFQWRWVALALQD